MHFSRSGIVDGELEKREGVHSHEQILITMLLPRTDLDHHEIPRTKVERTTSLRLIHTYGVEDPAGLRRPELGTSGVERGGRSSTSRFSRLDLREGERGGSPGARSNLNCVEGVPPSPLFIGGGGGEAPLEEGAALGLRPRVSSSLGLRQGGGGKLPGSSPRRPPLLGHLWPKCSLPLGPSK